MPYMHYGGSLRFAAGVLTGLLLRGFAGRKGKKPPRSLLVPAHSKHLSNGTGDGNGSGGGGGGGGLNGRGLHSFRFQLNFRSSVHRVTQLDS